MKPLKECDFEDLESSFFVSVQPGYHHSCEQSSVWIGISEKREKNDTAMALRFLRKPGTGSAMLTSEKNRRCMIKAVDVVKLINREF